MASHFVKRLLPQLLSSSSPPLASCVQGKERRLEKKSDVQNWKMCTACSLPSSFFYKTRKLFFLNVKGETVNQNCKA